MEILIIVAFTAAASAIANEFYKRDQINSLYMSAFLDEFELTWKIGDSIDQNMPLDYYKWCNRTKLPILTFDGEKVVVLDKKVKKTAEEQLSYLVKAVNTVRTSVSQELQRTESAQ